MLLYFTFALALLNMASVRAGRVLLPLYALHLGAQPFGIGVLAATFSVFPMALSWPVGKLSDRFGSRWLLMLGAAGGACGMLVPYFAPSLPALYVAAAMNGISFAFYNVSLQNVVGQLSEPHQRALNFSNFSLVLAVASFAGPLLAGLSIDHLGHAVACLNLVGLSLTPVALLLIWGGKLPGGGDGPKSGGGVLEALATPGMWRVLATSSLVVTGVDLFQFYLPIYGHRLDLSATVIGIILAMFSAAAFVVRLGLPRLLAAVGAERVLAYAFYLGAASFVLIPFFKSAPMLALLSFTFGLGMGCGQPITMMLTFSGSAQGRSGEVLGLRLTANHLTRVIGPVIFGSIGSAFGLPPVFWTNALMLACGGLLTRAGHNRPR